MNIDTRYMIAPDQIKQQPEPDRHILAFRGDTQMFSLSLTGAEKGSAWLRTNIGQAEIRKEEIIREVLYDETRLGRDWFDIPMERVGDQYFEVTVPLCEVGHFEAKCYYLPHGSLDPVWPEGGNTVINVEPADTCCSNIVYNAFVRQFGPNKEGKKPQGSTIRDSIRALEHSGYAVIPPSGTFRDLIRELDFIIGELGCRFIMLLPIHPTPTTFAKMGRFGSPYAALSFKTVDPALSEFDPKATPTEQFIELVDAIHARNAKVLMDIAINHTGWAADLHSTNPEWLVRDTEGKIEAPGAWGVVWEDLTKLDYSHRELWQHMAEVFLLWCRRGVDGFRCDAGYMIPSQTWTYITAVVRKQFPDTIFFLEGLGGKISVTRDLLNRANLNWAYSELFQNYDRIQIEDYLPEPIEVSKENGVMIHFAETHDNLRLAERSKHYARMRTALCALCSQYGGFGFANGVEWFATERIDVHRANSLNWGAKQNQVQLIGRLNRLLKTHPAFHDHVELALVHEGEEDFIALLRHHMSSGKRVLVTVNLNLEDQIRGAWKKGVTDFHGSEVVDLITGNKVNLSETGGVDSCVLEPGQVLCLTTDREDLVRLNVPSEQLFSVPERIRKQQYCAKALDVYRFYNGMQNLGGFDLDQAARNLAEDPVAYCRSLNVFSSEPRVITWQWARDVKREVMVPPDHFLLVRSEFPFRARITDMAGDEETVLSLEDSLPCSDGAFFTLFSPLPPSVGFRHLDLGLTVNMSGRSEHQTAHLLFLPEPEEAFVKRRFSRPELLTRSLLLLGTNGRGGMLRAHVPWGKLSSKYDALLSANLNPIFPEDRWVMFSRIRLWAVYQGYSTEINNDCLDSFSYDDSYCGYWRYHIPCGQGQDVFLTIAVEMAREENAFRISFYRHRAGQTPGRLADSKDVRIILRPDIEDRNFHETVKAYRGPEKIWPESVSPHADGFTFALSKDRLMEVLISKGSFIAEPEWLYMVHRSMEAERGMDPDSDLFSPGYFSVIIKGGETVNFSAEARRVGEHQQVNWKKMPQNLEDPVPASEANLKFPEALLPAMESFIVRREKLKTIIAGYPWFLDWGRDTLIFVRGLIAAGRMETSRAILEQFGRFEERGTLPNMIRGDDAGNRDTSDSPLWYFVACSDLVNAEGGAFFLDTDSGGRTIREVLISMAHSLMAGTPNGIRMDPDSGLIFSPAHFTWMDTNHPTGTPREGYPVEIQALWFFALCFLVLIDDEENRSYWRNKASLVQKSILDFFPIEKEGFLSDCLHARPGEPARKARPDDALRPNQLLAVTMGVVTDMAMCRRIVNACEELLVPGAIRSLADREVRYPLPVVHCGEIVNTPNQPYMGIYTGDEDTQRKPAYHNGTAWSWVFPSFCEAWVKAYGDTGKKTALSWLVSGTLHLNSGCAGHVPEILDGDYPHTQRGCDAQAWGTSELLRVWLAINGRAL